MLNAFREQLARIVGICFGVVAGVYLAGQRTDEAPAALIVAIAILIVVVLVGAFLAAAIQTSRIGRP